jgi:hypothetical protein
VPPNHSNFTTTSAKNKCTIQDTTKEKNTRQLAYDFFTTLSIIQYKPLCVQAATLVTFFADFFAGQ